MKIIADNNLFWFIPQGAELDLDREDTLDTYLQQVVSHGQEKDVRETLKIVDPRKLKGSFQRISRFLPFEIKKFWEDYIDGNLFDSRRNS